MKIHDLIVLKETALHEAKDAKNDAAVEAVRVKYVGRRGLLPEIMKGLKNMDPGERPKAGQIANALKTELQILIEDRQREFSLSEAKTEDNSFDYTLPGEWRSIGSLHPISKLIEQMVDIFHSLGFIVADGPDIETPFYNFDALNTPAEHPSRDLHDTFYLEDGHLLRTHTSPVQIRYMENRPPPVRIVVPGRCFRRDTTDATHSANFHQVEGLYVDREVSMADLKGDLNYFAQQLMGPKVKIRFRPHFFPFTEPSVEVDFSCHVCAGKGCRVCKNSRWIEIAGAGMVDPEVFKAVGYDPDKVTGYAFGLGIERIAMILYGIDDIRQLYENDVRFLEQF
ncbi:MAG: phenylalanine--tRNA ligase subunit alpha [Kiritimatiellae bacterium]|nr:phenylalanine--tRNA ligase subunit alpha [Kiritimatiellia bacterium]